MANLKSFKAGDLVYIGVPEVWGDVTFYKATYMFKNPGGHTAQMIDLYPIGYSDRRGGSNEVHRSHWSIIGESCDGPQRADVSDHYIYPYGNINAIRILYGKSSKKSTSN
jgi:hypothetical protein